MAWRGGSGGGEAWVEGGSVCPSSITGAWDVVVVVMGVCGMDGRSRLIAKGRKYSYGHRVLMVRGVRWAAAPCCEKSGSGDDGIWVVSTARRPSVSPHTTTVNWQIPRSYK